MLKAIQILQRFSTVHESAYGVNHTIVASLGEINDAIIEAISSSPTLDQVIKEKNLEAYAHDELLLLAASLFADLQLLKQLIATHAINSEQISKNTN